jgi:GTP-binding protein HflX
MLTMRRMVQHLLGSVHALLPYSESGLLQECYDYGRVLKAEYREDGIYIEAELVAEMRSKLDRFLIEPDPSKQ